MDQINTSPNNFLPTSTSEMGHGQAFTGNGGTINEARFRLKADNVGSWNGGNMWVEIYAHSGTWGSDGVPTGNSLAISEIIDLQSIGDFDDWITFVFSGNNQFQTVAGQHYFAVLYHNNIGFYAGPDVGVTNNPVAFNGGTTAYLKYNGGWQQISDRILLQILGTSPTSTFTVAYNGNGATGGNVPVDNNSYQYNATVTVAANPGGLVKSGHKFLGWSQLPNAPSPNFGVTGSTVTPPNFTIIASNVTLYAIWQIVPYSALIMDQVNTVANNFLPTSTNLLSYGQAFTGNGGVINEVRFRLVAANVGLWSGGSMVASIYAHSGTWGSDGVPTGNSLAISEIIDLQSIGDFDGWITFVFSGNNQFQTVAGQHYFVVLSHDNSGFYAGPDVGVTNNSVAFNGGTAVSQNHLGYWQQIGERILFQVLGTSPVSTFKVVYNGNGNTGGSVPVDNNSYQYDVAVTVAANPGGLVRSGYKFLGWSQLSNASVPTFSVTGSSVVPSSFNTIATDVTLFAVWQLIQYFTVTYHENGATSGSVPVDANSPYLNGSVVSVLGHGTLGYHLYLFGGWSTESTGPVEYSLGDTFIITGNVDLYAVWYSTGPPVGNQYQVFYNGNGSTGGNPPVDYNVYQDNGVVTVLGQGSLLKSGHAFLGWSTNPSATSATYVQGSTFSIHGNSVTLHAVWSSGSTIVVPYNGCEAGSNSKQTTHTYNGASTIMQVATNLPNNIDENAIIENLIIDGLNLSNNATGILLENVCNCLIRNVTIMNCEVGIKIKLTGSNGNFSRNNRFEHIRMINVKTGILFEGTSSAKDFSYTTIEDVGISLVGNSTDTGIKIGNDNVNANLYGAFVKVNVWLNESGGKGLEVNGQIKGGLVNLAVAENGNNSGRCIVLNTNAVISNNQSFLLTSLGVANNIVNNGGSYSGIKIVT